MTFASWLRGMAHGNDRINRSSRPGEPRFRRSTRRLALDIFEDRTVPSTVAFAAAQTFPSGGTGGVHSVATADFNNDGHADLAVTKYVSGTVGVLLANGSGGFASPVSVSSGGIAPLGPYSIAAGDFNNDGNADLAVANSLSHNLGMLLGDGSGGFAPVVTFGTGGSSPRAVVVGDFNNDGNADLALANMFSDNVGVLLGNGTGSFATAVVFGTGDPRPISVAVGDFNNDGNADLATANVFSNSVCVLLGNGLGGFGTASTFASGGANPQFVAGGDFNSDGRTDLVVSNTNSSNVSVHLANATGGFSLAATFPASQAHAITIADFNNDGQADFAVVNFGIGVGVRLGDGLGGFATSVDFGIGGSIPFGVAAADFDNDGRIDLAATDRDTGNVGVLLNTTVINQPPVNTVPDDQVAAEDVAKVIGGFSVADVNDAAGILTVTLSAGHGTIRVNWGVAGGVLLTGISGNGTATVVMSGTQAQINATLGAGLTYLGLLDYSGLDTMTMTTTDAGGLTDTDAVAIQVLDAQQQAEVLAAIIADLGDDGTLSGGVENSLLKKLGFLSGPNATATVQAFINQVNGLVYAGILTQGQGNYLIGAAATIVASLQ